MKQRFQQNALLILAAVLILGLVGVMSFQSTRARRIKTVTIEPKGNQLLFADTSFTAAPGQKVKIVFNNTATIPAMYHNVVVLDTMDTRVITRVGQATIQNMEQIPTDPSILAHTPAAKPGETVEVTFTAPEEPGTYPYICTFPGHYDTMQGTMIVEDPKARTPREMRP